MSTQQNGGPRPGAGRPPGTKDTSPHRTRPRRPGAGRKPGPNARPPCDGCGLRSRGHHKEGCEKKAGGKPVIKED